MPQPPRKRVRSVKATSGRGFSFETKVAAWFAAHLLADAKPLPDLKFGRLVRLRLQAHSLGWTLDDLVTEFERREIRCGWSIKSYDPRGTTAPADLLEACWEQIARHSFDRSRDRLGLICAPAETKHAATLDEVRQAARSVELETFEQQLRSRQRFSPPQQALAESFRRPAKFGRGRSCETSPWHVLSILEVVEFDSDRIQSNRNADAIRMCRDALVAEHRDRDEDLWDALCAVTDRRRGSAGSIDAEILIDELGDRFALIAAGPNAASPRTTRRRPSVLAPTLALVLAALLAAAVWWISRPGVEPLRADGGLSVLLPDVWSATDAREIPGLPLRGARAAVPPAPPDAKLVLGISDAAGPDLLEPRLLSRNPGARPREVWLDDVAAYEYRSLRVPKSEASLRTYSVPTTFGLVVIACLSRDEDADRFASACADGAATLDLPPHTALPLGPNPAYAKRVSAILERLEEARRPQQLRLERGTPRRLRADAASVLAIAFGTAATRLRALRPSPRDKLAHDQLGRRLEEASRAYSELQKAAVPLRPRKFNAAAEAAEAAEQRVREAQERLHDLEYTLI